MQHPAPATSDQEEMNRELRFCDPSTAEHPDLHTFLAVWNAARGTHPMPKRSEIDPKSLRSFLKRIHLYEVLNGGENFRCRLAGDAVYMSYNANMFGKLITEHPHPGIRDRVLVMLRRVVATARPVYVRSLTGQLHPSRHPLIENLWLPLGEDGAVTQVITQTVYRKP